MTMFQMTQTYIKLAHFVFLFSWFLLESFYLKFIFTLLNLDFLGKKLLMETLSGLPCYLLFALVVNFTVSLHL